MRIFLLRIKIMILKELLSTLKDPKTKAILIAPVFAQSIIFGYVATYDLDKVPYALLDLSHSKESSELIAKIDGSTAFERVATLSNANEIKNLIDSGEIILAVSIPQNFSQKLLTEKNSAIQVITDGRNTMTASLAQSYVGNIVGNFNSSRNPKLNSVTVETISWYNPNLITRWNFLPTLMIMLGLVQVLMLSGLSVAREREQGTFDQLLVTPLSPLQILIGKAVAPILIGIFQSTIVLLICRFFSKFRSREIFFRFT